MDLFGRVFMEDVGLEAGSVVSELGGFPVKEAKFRRDMEKLRNSQQKDITLSKVCDSTHIHYCEIKYKLHILNYFSFFPPIGGT